MKAFLFALVGLSLSASVLAAEGDDNQMENVYASQLCHIVSTEKKTSDLDTYTAKMKSQLAASQSSSAVDKPEFNEETAQEVISAWMELGDDERAQLRHNQQQCEQTVMTQFQQQD
ncbi:MULTISPECIES: hypothetical protein [Pantoea]|uniref:Uncharacterized protein n=2 Tax=Pantoea TaxID=53335 RepID=A0A0U3U5W0_9GAMM|nr:MULTISPECIES: hypothetical protein [Pantoea]ALV90671.1 hypothetical protein LK04_00235 [Pantoea vagans]KHJ69500.1 hypothetical protein QU24_03050 [Pantoea rodasii]